MGCPLDQILITPLLKKRVTRAPTLTDENDALCRLSQQLLEPPLEQLQHLLECAMALCSAGSSGISLAEEDHGSAVFRWVALAGKYRHLVGGMVPRNDSPCGVTLELGEPQLFDRPGRRFACLEHADPPIVEGLVIPIKGLDSAPGTIWIVSHSRATEFDMEDARIMTSLAGFASFACQQLVMSAARHGD